MSTHAAQSIPQAQEWFREELRHVEGRRPAHTAPIPTVKETHMCIYCGGLLPAGTSKPHQICREEACERPAALTSCPDDTDGPCAACDPGAQA